MLNSERISRNVIVVGASAGGVETLIALFGRLPADLEAVVAVVLHRSRVHQSRLAEVLGRRAALAVRDARQGERPVPGTIYLAPSDRHLLFEADHLRVDGGPREHHTRPAVDPLFVSAAQAFGPRVVGVVLTGTGDDGVHGLIAIKAAGGLSLAQDPQEARYATMPLNAITRDRVDAALPVGDLALTLAALVEGKAVEFVPTQAGSRVAP
jgi:two-component system chemotaxis response regulator CheB